MKYNDDFPLLAEGYAREGLSDKQIALKLGISQQTFYNYQKRYVEFLEAIKRGKAPVDIEIENQLLKRARGYEYEETRAEYENREQIQADGSIKNVPIIVKKVITKKHMAASETAIIFWLCNRKPDKWKRNDGTDERSDLSEINKAMQELARKTKEKEME